MPKNTFDKTPHSLRIVVENFDDEVINCSSYAQADNTMRSRARRVDPTARLKHIGHKEWELEGYPVWFVIRRQVGNSNPK